MQTEAFVCGICMELMLSSNRDLVNRCTCGHSFCTDCKIKYIKAKLEDNIGIITCPTVYCDQFLEPLTCQSLVGPRIFMRWCDVLCESMMIGLRKSYCPNRRCSELIVDECRDGERVTKTKCPRCKQLFCFRCKVPWHVGFLCDEAKRFTRDANGQAFGALAERKRWMRCPNCHNFVERNGGCPAITCRCKCVFCYECGSVLNKNHRCSICDEETLQLCFMVLSTVLFVLAFIAVCSLF